MFTETDVTIFHIDGYFTPGPSNHEDVGGCGGNQIESRFFNHLLKPLCCSLHAKRVSSPAEAHTSNRLFVFSDIRSATFFTHHSLALSFYFYSIHPLSQHIPSLVLLSYFPREKIIVYGIKLSCTYCLRLL